MRSTLVSIVMMASIAGCVSPDQDPVVNHALDSLLKAQRAHNEQNHARLAFEQDSIQKAQEQIAFGSLRFGMPSDTVRTLVKKMADPRGFINMGNTTYSLRTRFTGNDRLYRIEFSGVRQNASFLKTTVLESARNLAAVIETKYGPASEQQGNPDFFKYKPGAMQVMHRWVVGAKEIQVGIREVSTGSQYSAEAWIWNTAMQNAVLKASEAKTAAERAKASSNL